MNLTRTESHLVDILEKIIDFTNLRDRIITDNILNVNKPNFEPHDVDAGEFADVMAEALKEYIANNRLILRDSNSIKFTENGSFECLPVCDKYAKKLFQNNIQQYIELQIARLSENLLNCRIAKEMLAKCKSSGCGRIDME
jgi:flagellar basal body rod protein FlgB